MRCQYAVAAQGDAFTAEALCTTAQGRTLAWGYVRPHPGQRAGVPGALGVCSPRGVWSPRDPTTPQLNTVGPCDADSAR